MGGGPDFVGTRVSVERVWMRMEGTGKFSKAKPFARTDKPLDNSKTRLPKPSIFMRHGFHRRSYSGLQSHRTGWGKHS